MRKICSVCGAKEALFFGGAKIRTYEGVCICKECYYKKHGNLDAHPIPDEVTVKSLSEVGITMPTETEFVFTDPLFDAKFKIHKLMWWVVDEKRTVYKDTFFGIDRYSKKLVYVLFSEDDTASDGGPSYLNVVYLPYENFFGLMKKYPEQVRSVFSDLSDDTIDKYLNVHVPLDMVSESYLLTQNKGDITKVAYYGIVRGWCYAEVKTESFEDWRRGKSSLELIDTLGELIKASIRYIDRVDCQFLLTILPKEIKSAFENCANNSETVSAEEANFIITRSYSYQLEERKVSAEVAEDVFDFIYEKFVLTNKVKENKYER